MGKKRETANIGGKRRQDNKQGGGATSEHEDLAIPVPQAQHEAWYQLLRAHGKIIQRLETRLLQGNQIPHHWYDVLVTLEKAPGHRLRMSELADNIVTSRSNLTRLVDRLAAEGLLRREPCPDDGRGSFAVLTEAGLEARMAAWPVMSRAIVELFATQVTPQEAQLLSEILRRVADGEPQGHTIAPS